MVAPLMSILGQQVMQKFAQNSPEATPSALLSAVFGQRKAGLPDLLRGEAAVMACCYQ